VLSSPSTENGAQPTLLCVSLGHGTQVAPVGIAPDGQTVYDLHAEVLARRALLLFLYQQLALMYNPESELMASMSIFVANDEGAVELKVRARRPSRVLGAAGTRAPRVHERDAARGRARADRPDERDQERPDPPALLRAEQQFRARQVDERADVGRAEVADRGASPRRRPPMCSCRA